MNKSIKIVKPIRSFKKTVEIEGDKSLSIRWALLASQSLGKSKVNHRETHQKSCLRASPFAAVLRAGPFAAALGVDAHGPVKTKHVKKRWPIAG